MSSEITFSKGGTTITVSTIRVAENYTNKLFVITPAQSPANQGSGPKDNQIVDLLRITHQFVIQGHINGTASKTAKEVKDDLAIIYNGGSTAGGVTTMVYDGDTLYGYIEKLNFIEVPADNPSTSIKDYGKYEISVTFIEGVAV